MRNKISNINLKILFIITSILMAMPSISYLIRNKTIIRFNSWFTFFLRKPKTRIEAMIGALMLGILILISIYTYFKLVKNNKSEFKTIKEIIIFILIVSCIYGIMIPFTSSDIFYYMGTGRIDFKYNQNPYYTTMKEVKEINASDKFLQRAGTVWENQLVVYGPLWALICKILVSFSFNNVTLSLYIFKIFAIGIHVLNSILVYKITHKKMFLCLYGFNPFMLFEMITNVHNDIYMIFFILLSIYFLLKKKNIVLTVIFMAIATSIKYVSVLLVPFFVLYYYRKEKILKKLEYSIQLAILFIFVFTMPYLFYIKDLTMLKNIFMQQGKYRESILFLVLLLSRKFNFQFDILKYITRLLIFIFVIVYISRLIYMVFYKKINFSRTIRKYNLIILIFTFCIITNLCPWYMSWFIPTLFWLNGKHIKNIIYLQFSYELVTLINFWLFSESYKLGILYLPIMIIIILVFNFINKKINLKEERLEQNSFN